MTEITVYYRPMGEERSEVLLRLAASRFTGIPPGEFEILREPGKKPLFLRPPDLYASVSHSGGVWAAAFSREFPVGLDIQISVFGCLCICCHHGYFNSSLMVRMI